MARRSDITEPLIPVDAVVAQSGLSGEWVWRQFADGEVVRDWNNSYAVRWSTAKRITDTARELHADSDRRNREMRERQEREFERQLEEARQRGAARAGASRTLGGVRVSLPGEPHTPDWMKDKGGE